MKAFYSPLFPLNLPPDHRFPMRKYSRLREVLLEDGIVQSGDMIEAPLVEREDLCRVHDPAYVERVEKGGLSDRELRRLGFPWSVELATRARASVGASVAAAQTALFEGLGVNLAGGTHHAGRDYGSGYCVFNDFAVTARSLLARGLSEKILILDLDVHQGDGTALLLASEPAVFTASIHGKDNFPFRKAVSCLDVALPAGAGDGEYLDALERVLREVRERFGEPGIVLYLAGADPHEDDRFGRMKLTLSGLRRRDERVMREFAPKTPMVVAMGGGYGRSVETVARIHATTVGVAARAYDEGGRPDC
ncbi:MAG: histone deacetylase [Thermoanaerobaculia bacterium]|nr:Acetoin utilization protein AcuC [Thermoanaerobaculia bacterium]MCK6683962.1 histone deacetylase [Thermoanaerobaculia bacterium]